MSEDHSVLMSQLTSEQAAQVAELDAQARRLTKLLAYLLCIFLGTFGLHRFYMRRKGSALAMLLITVLTLGIGALITFVWAIVDLFLILGIIG